jgi:hypothetical protein
VKGPFLTSRSASGGPRKGRRLPCQHRYVCRGPTDTATITPTPSLTATRTPAAVPSPTPSPAPSLPPTEEAASAYVADNPDGSSTYFDPELGYKVTFPESWVILELTAEDVSEAMDQAAEAYPGNESLFDLAVLGAENVRMTAFDLNPSSLVEGEPPSVNITAQLGSASASLDLLIHSAEQILPQIIPGTEVLSTEVTTNPQGVELGIIECVISLQSESDVLEHHVVQAYFRTSAGLVIFSASARAAVFDRSSSQFEAIMDSISPLEAGNTSP